MLNEKQCHIIAKQYLKFKKHYELWVTVKILTGKESNS